jgi:hypothetical protein
MDRARRGQPGLSNEEIRQITHYDRNHSRNSPEPFEEYGLPKGERLNEIITQSWNRLQKHWAVFPLLSEYSLGSEYMLLDEALGAAIWHDIAERASRRDAASPSMAMESEKITGFALTLDGKVVHMSVFARETAGAGGEARFSRMARYSRRRQNRVAS